MVKPDWYVYIVRCADGSLYTGVSTDVAARVAAHNKGKGAKYTRSRLPVTLVYLERPLQLPKQGRSWAQHREAEIKALPKREKESLVRDHVAAVLRGRMVQLVDLAAAGRLPETAKVLDRVLKGMGP